MFSKELEQSIANLFDQAQDQNLEEHVRDNTPSKVDAKNLYNQL